MSTRFSPPQLEQLKRRAKELRRINSSLTQAEALNLVAREQGFPNWPLLVKNSLPSVDELVSLNCQQFPGGMEGVQLVEMAIVGQEFRGVAANYSPLFRLPKRSGWLFRGAGPRQHEFLPYIDLRHGDPRGVFVDCYWRAILSVNGVQESKVQAHMTESLAGVLHDLKISAFEGLMPLVAGRAPTAGGRVRLFFSKPGANGVAELAERTYATIEEAKDAELPAGCVKIGIPQRDGTWMKFQEPFGWSVA